MNWDFIGGATLLIVVLILCVWSMIHDYRDHKIAEAMARHPAGKARMPSGAAKTAALINRVLKSNQYHRGAFGPGFVLEIFVAAGLRPSWSFLSRTPNEDEWRWAYEHFNDTSIELLKAIFTYERKWWQWTDAYEEVRCDY